MSPHCCRGIRLASTLLVLLTVQAVPAALVVSPTNQHFVGRFCEEMLGQTVSLSNSGPSDLTWTRTVSYSSGASGWVSFQPPSDVLLASNSVTLYTDINLSGVTAGVYVATNSINAGPDGTSVVVVTLTVSNCAALTVSPTSLSYSVAIGQNLSSFQTVIVSNSGDGTCIYTTLTNRYDASGATNWLNVTPLSGALADGGFLLHTVKVVNAATIFASPGTYYATNEIGRATQFGYDDPITNAPIFLQVVVTVTGSLPSALTLAPGSQSFRGRPDTNYVPQTFVLSNTGAVPLTWTSTVSYSANGTDWYLFSPSTSALGAGASQTWTSRVDASGLTGGVYVATNHFQAGPAHAADLVATLTVSTNYASLVVTPGSLNFNGTLGQDITGSQTILVSNNGFGPCSYTVQTNTYDASGASGWLSVTPTSAFLNDSGVQIHTIRIQNASTVFSNTGTFYATNEIGRAGSFAIANTPVYLPVSVTISGLPAPLALTATNDGIELARLGWAGVAGYSNLVVWRDGAPPSSDPVSGVAYPPGSTIGGGTVLFRGSSRQGFEHMVATNAIHYYRVYNITNNNYSAALQTATTSGSYRAGLIYEPFAFSNGLSVAGNSNRGNGWLGAWTNTGVTVLTVETNYGAAAVPGFPNFGNFATNRANRLNLNVTVDNTAGSAYRSLPPLTSGTIYVSAILSPQYGGPGKYTGLRLYSNTTERFFFGELGLPTNKFGVSINSGSPELIANYDINPYDGGGGYTGNVYVVILRYNFATHTANGKAYYSTIPVDSTEPTNWDVTGSAPANVTYLNGLDIVSGGFVINSVSNQPGRTLFDEVRIATSWTGLLADAALPFSGGGDQDGDGLPDAWETQYFGGPTNASPLGDTDSDGFFNVEEYLADTVPTNGNSYFRNVTNLSGTAVWSVTLAESSTARLYDVYWKTNLLDTNDWQPTGLNVPGSGGSLNLTATNSAPELFRRTGVRLP